MVEYLVKNGADVLKPDRCGNAPIHITCKHVRLDILKLGLNRLGLRNEPAPQPQHTLLSSLKKQLPL